MPKVLRSTLEFEPEAGRFSIPVKGSVKVEPVLYDLEDLWMMADRGGEPGRVMTFEEMDEAKARRHW